MPVVVIDTVPLPKLAAADAAPSLLNVGRLDRQVGAIVGGGDAETVRPRHRAAGGDGERSGAPVERADAITSTPVDVGRLDRQVGAGVGVVREDAVKARPCHRAGGGDRNRAAAAVAGVDAEIIAGDGGQIIVGEHQPVRAGQREGVAAASGGVDAETGVGRHHERGAVERLRCRRRATAGVSAAGTGTVRIGAAHISTIAANEGACGKGGAKHQAPPQPGAPVRSSFAALLSFPGS